MPKTMTTEELFGSGAQVVAEPEPARTLTTEEMFGSEQAQIVYEPPAQYSPDPNQFSNPLERVLRETGTNQNAPAVVSDVAAGLTQAGMGAAGITARATGFGDADQINRAANAYGQQAEAAQPGMLNAALRGSVASAPGMIAGGIVGGPVGAIGAGVAQQVDPAITQGRDAGLSGADLAGYVAREGAIEAIPALVMQRFGLGGVEAIFGKQAGGIVRSGIKSAALQLGGTAAAEMPEELVTEIGHSVNTALSGVDPSAITPEALWNTAAQTALQTLITTGAFGAPRFVATATGRDVPQGAAQPADAEDVSVDGAETVEIAPPDAQTPTGPANITVAPPDYVPQEVGLQGFGVEPGAAPPPRKREIAEIPSGGPMVEGPQAPDLSDPEGLNAIYNQVFGGGTMQDVQRQSNWNRYYAELIRAGLDPQDARAEVDRKMAALFNVPFTTPEGSVAAIPENAPEQQGLQGLGAKEQPPYFPRTPQQAQGMGPNVNPEPDSGDALSLAAEADPVVRELIRSGYSRQDAVLTAIRMLRPQETPNETAQTEPVQDMAVPSPAAEPGGTGVAGRAETAGNSTTAQESSGAKKDPIDLTKISESAIAAFPDMQQSTEGLIPLSRFTPDEAKSLRDAGIVRTETSADGRTYEGVDEEYLWRRRKQLQEEQKAQRDARMAAVQPGGGGGTPQAVPAAPAEVGKFDVTAEASALEEGAAALGYSSRVTTASTGTRYYTFSKELDDDNVVEVTVRVGDHGEVYTPQHGERRISVDPYGLNAAQALSLLKDPTAIPEYDATEDRAAQAEANAAASRRAQETPWGKLSARLGAAGVWQGMKREYSAANPQQRRALVARWAAEHDTTAGTVFSALTGGKTMPKNFSDAVKRIPAAPAAEITPLNIVERKMLDAANSFPWYDEAGIIDAAEKLAALDKKQRTAFHTAEALQYYSQGGIQQAHDAAKGDPNPDGTPSGIQLRIEKAFPWTAASTPASTPTAPESQNPQQIQGGTGMEPSTPPVFNEKEYSEVDRKLSAGEYVPTPLLEKYSDLRELYSPKTDTVRDRLYTMPRTELVALAKQFGIKANLATPKLAEALAVIENTATEPVTTPDIPVTTMAEPAVTAPITNIVAAKRAYKQAAITAFGEGTPEYQRAIDNAGPFLRTAKRADGTWDATEIATGAAKRAVGGVTKTAGPPPDIPLTPEEQDDEMLGRRDDGRGEGGRQSLMFAGTAPEPSDVVETTIRRLSAQARGRGVIRFVRRLTDMPDDVRKEYSDRVLAGGSVRGVYNRSTGITYFMSGEIAAGAKAANVPTDVFAAGIWLHEQGVHHGLELLSEQDRSAAIGMVLSEVTKDDMKAFLDPDYHKLSLTDMAEEYLAAVGELARTPEGRKELGAKKASMVRRVWRWIVARLLGEHPDLARLRRVPKNVQHLTDALIRGVEEGRATGRAGRGIAFSQTGSALDRDYLAAVERGDMDTAQRMVDDAAKKAGYKTKAYHAGTVNNKFDESFSGTGLVGVKSSYVFFGSDKGAVEYYAEPESGRNIRAYYIKADGLVEFEGGSPRGNADSAFMDSYEKDEDFHGAVTRDVFDGDSKMDVYTLPFNDDGTITSAKSADPVTYDDAGNVIPLSKRFDATKSDIRFSATRQSNPFTDPETRAMYEEQLASYEPERMTREQIAEAAKKIPYAEVTAALMQGRQLTAAEEFRAQQLITTATKQYYKQPVGQRDEDLFAKITELSVGRMRGGTLMGRDFAMRRDPNKTPRDHFIDAITDGMQRPTEATEAELNEVLDALENPATPQSRKPALRAKKKAVMDKVKREVKRLNEKLEAAGIDLGGLIERLQNAPRGDDFWDSKDFQDAASAIRAMQAHNASYGDAAYEWYLNSILSGPQTMVVNGTSNIFMGAWDLIAQRFVEAGVNTITRKSDAAQWGEFVGMFRGMGPVFAKALRNAMASWRSEMPVFAMRMGTNPGEAIKFDKGGVAISGRKGKVVRSFGFKPLLFTDEFTKTVIGHMEVAAHAYRIAKAEGLTGDAATKRQAALIEDLQSDAWKRAMESATRLSFQEKLGGRAQRVQNAIAGSPARWFVPFVKTPFNILKTGVRKSPIGILNTVNKIARGRYNGNGDELVRNLAENVMSIGMAAALYGMLSGDDDEPWITGTVPFGSTSKGERDLAYRNAPPLSINIPGFGWVSYARVEPFATSVALTVDAINAMREAESAQDVGKVASKFVDGFMSNLTEKTYLAGLGDMYKTITDESERARWLANFTASWVPNIVRQPLRASDPAVREMKGMKFGDRVGYTMFPIPALRPEPKVNLWGEPVTKGPGMGPASDAMFRIVSPAQVQPIQTGKVRELDRMITNWNLQHPDEPRYFQAPVNTFTVRGKAVELTPKEYHDYLKQAGEMALKRLEARKFRVQNPTIHDMNALDDAIRDARAMVRRRMIAKGLTNKP